MPSDRPGSPDPLARLADVLAEARGGVRPTSLELAELLWLAGQLEPRGETPRPAPPDPAPDVPQQRLPPPTDEPATTPPAPEPTPAAPRVSARAPLHLPSPAPSARGAHASLLAPAPPMLRHPLGLQRALRPLKRRTDAPSGHRLDERATADRIARLGAAPEWWLPVLRPARERWLRLNLVYDTGPTMPVWRPLVRELHTALAQSGIFRTVTLLRAAPDGTVHGHGTHTPADGRTVTLVISDCMGPQWRPGKAGQRWNGTLRRWIRQLPVAVVQPLPEHLWRDTALPAAPGLLSAPHPAAPTAALTFAPYDTYDDTPADGLPLPVLEPDPKWLANWAGLLTAAGGTAFPGSAALLDRPLAPKTRTDISQLSPEELVLRFRAASSPEAFRLAGHLTLGRPDLPVMRLVQRAVEADPRPQHLAEVILSGLLTSVSGPPGSYAFRPGVRDLLLRSLPRSSRGRTTELLARVGGLIEERAGAAPGEFRAVTPATGGAGPVGADGEAIATVRPETVRRLTGQTAAPAGRYGEYRLVRRLAPGGSVWLAEGVADSERVALRLLEPVAEPARREAFLRDAARLKELVHPNLVPVRGFGIEGDVPYVAMEYLDGVAQRTLAARSGYLLPPPLVASIASELAHAVTALHGAGLTHGGIGPSQIMLLPGGAAKLAVREPGRTSGPEGRAEDLRALCELLLQLTAGTSRLTLPVWPDELGRLPRTLQDSYARAFNLLMSSSLEDQERGADLLTREELLLRAREAYGRRFYYVLGPMCAELPVRTPEFAPLEQAALALLLLRNGRTVTYEQFRTGLWDRGDEPEDAVAVLGRVASRLRNALGPGTLATLPDGYALHTSADYVDLVHCEELERTATALADQGSLEQARDCLESALRLWRSAGPLADVPGPAARTARTSLRQFQLGLCRKRAEVDLEMGEYERAATDLGDLLRVHPDHEDFRRLLLIALRKLDRIEEALEVYQEYEWSGGNDPALLALGHELRGEYDDYEDPEERAQEYDAGPEYGAWAATDELPEGPYPTEEPSLLYGPEDPAEERPLPRDEVPESLFTGEDTHDEPVAPSRAVALFECVNGPGDEDDRAALGRAVVRLLVASGLDPARYALDARENGWSVRLELGVSELPLVAVTLQEFSDRVAETGGLRWQVTFFDEDGDVWHSTDELADHIRDMNRAQGIVRVSDALRSRLIDGGHPVQGLQHMSFRFPEGGWCLLAHPPSADTVDPVQGPFRLPARVPLPEPVGGTRAVVYTTYGTGLTLNRPAGSTFYYEVNLAERRSELDERGPVVDGVRLFRATGEVVWRITDPVAAVATVVEGSTARGHIQRLVRSHLDHLTLNYPPTPPRVAFNDLPRDDAVSGCTVRWPVDLIKAGASPAPVKRRVRADLVDALRKAQAVVLGFDGLLADFTSARRAAEVVPSLRREFEFLDDSPQRHPVNLLQAHELHRSAPDLRTRLAALETTAASLAGPVPDADLLVRTLADRGRTLAVVADCARQAAEQYLWRRRLMSELRGGVHGRYGVDSPVRPIGNTLDEAVRATRVRRRRCLVIATTMAEAAAAHVLGVKYVWVGATRTTIDETPVLGIPGKDGLRPLLDAARSL
ncbi:SAV_2336 N-terminal domain-related protein [Streptomyces sp. NPDC001450]